MSPVPTGTPRNGTKVAAAFVDEFRRRADRIANTKSRQLMQSRKSSVAFAMQRAVPAANPAPNCHRVAQVSAHLVCTAKRLVRHPAPGTQASLLGCRDLLAGVTGCELRRGDVLRATISPY